MKCAHLFNGIGGFALAAHWMGWENVMHCEIDPFCNKVMNHHFPNSYQHEDIRTTDFTIWRGRIDLLTGGDPCQPSSVAGKRKGKEDERYLWPEFYRSAKEIRPRIIVNENVPGTVSNGILDQKIIDLEDAGYTWWPPFVIPASSVGAPHRRDRVWLIAYSESSVGDLSKNERKNKMDASRDGCKGVTADAGCERLQVRVQSEESSNEKANETRSWSESPRTHTKTNWGEFPTQSPVCSGNDGFSDDLADFSVPSKRYGTRILTGNKAYGRWRKESLKAAGNAIVPQVAFEIFKAIEQYETN